MSTKLQAHSRFVTEFPAIDEAYRQLGSAAQRARPLDDRTRQMVELALAIGIRHEGPLHAHTRHPLETGVSSEAIKQVEALAPTTLAATTLECPIRWRLTPG